jgi:predicted AlkP superfamily pyrophosphatase or phosphodiesterase
LPSADSQPDENDLSPATGTASIQNVVIVSIDGLRPDALAQADTPVIDGLIMAGAYSPAAQSVLPSVTLINHASMLGGMSPAKHGIDWNDHRPELGQIKGPTVFSVAQEAGLSTAIVVGKTKLEHLVLPDSVDTYIYAGFLDGQIIEQAMLVIEAGLPSLLFIHLPDVDSAGHATGWMSPGQLRVVSHTDGLIGELMVALAEEQVLTNTLLIITADHGGVDKAHGGDTPEEMTIPWLAVGPGVPAGLRLHSDITVYDTAATALDALGLAVPLEWDGQPVREIFAQNSP